MKRCAAALLCALLILSSAPSIVAAPSERLPSWLKIESLIDDAARERKGGLPVLAKELAPSKPALGRDALRKVCVLMRAGMQTETAGALKELKALHRDLPNAHVASMYYNALALRAHDTARHILEVFAENVRQLSLGNHLLRQLKEDGWSFERIDRWLAQMPASRHGFWRRERLRFYAVHGRGAELAEAWATEVRNHPEDVRAAVRFLRALVRSRRAHKAGWDASWMVDVVEPKSVTDAESIASHLHELGNWAAAAAYYERALAIPPTAEERRARSRMRNESNGLPGPRTDWEVQEALCECLLELGEVERARRWAEEAAKLRVRDGLGPNVRLSGRLGVAIGQPVREPKAEKAARVRPDTPEHWRERARFYAASRRPALEEQSLRRWLDLTVPKARSERVTKGQTDERTHALMSLARFLERRKRSTEAVALLRNEVERSPVDAASVRRAADFLCTNFKRHLGTDVDYLWNWLSRRPVWDARETRVLRVLIRRTERGDREAQLNRAEKLVRGRHATRAYAFGSVLTRSHSARAIPFLERAANELSDEDQRRSASSTLFRAYIGVEDWQNAERVYPELKKRLTSREHLERYGDIAVAAAKAGANEDATRLWAGVINVNPSEMRDLAQLVRAGLREELVALYRTLQAQLPTSDVPARAMEILQSR